MKPVLGFLLCCLLLAPASQAGTKTTKKPVTAGERTLALRKALEGADKVEISAGQEKPEAPVTIQGADKIATLAKLFEADESLSARYKAEPVSGPGDFRLTFFREEKAVVCLDYFGERMLRWNDGPWVGRTFLSGGTEVAWPQWFKANGYQILDRRIKEWQEQRMLPQKRKEAFLKQLPAAARRAVERIWRQPSRYSPDDAAAEDEAPDNPAAFALLRTMGEPHPAGMSICRALSAMCDPAYDSLSLSDTDLVAVEAFMQISGYIMPSVFETAASDRTADAGAARLFFLDRCWMKVPGVMRDSVAPRLLRAAVERGQPLVALNAVIEAGELPGIGISDVFCDIAVGTITPATALRLKSKHLTSEPALPFIAAMNLARRGDARAGEIVNRLAALPGITDLDRGAVSVCRCYLGDRTEIGPGLFQLKSWTLGVAGVTALERQGDKAALNALITGATLHMDGGLPFAGGGVYSIPSREAVHAVQRMTGKVWYHAQPNENEDWYGKDIREWWVAASDSWQPLRER